MNETALEELLHREEVAPSDIDALLAWARVRAQELVVGLSEDPELGLLLGNGDGSSLRSSSPPPPPRGKLRRRQSDPTKALVDDSETGPLLGEEELGAFEAEQNLSSASSPVAESDDDESANDDSEVEDLEDGDVLELDDFEILEAHASEPGLDDEEGVPETEILSFEASDRVSGSVSENEAPRVLLDEDSYPEAFIDAIAVPEDLEI